MSKALLKDLQNAAILLDRALHSHRRMRADLEDKISAAYVRVNSVIDSLAKLQEAENGGK